MVPEVLGSRISSTVAQWLDLRHLGPHRRVHRHSNPWGKARPQDVAGDGSMDDSMMSIKCIYDIVTYIYIVYSYLYNWRWIHDDRPSNERFKVNYIEFAHANYIYIADMHMLWLPSVRWKGVIPFPVFHERIMPFPWQENMQQIDRFGLHSVLGHPCRLLKRDWKLWVNIVSLVHNYLEKKCLIWSLQ
jgi:hypothetical protein